MIHVICLFVSASHTGGRILWLVCEIRCSKKIKYMEFISRYSTSDWHSARQVFTCSCSSNLLLGRDPSSQCSEASGLQAREGLGNPVLEMGLRMWQQRPLQFLKNILQLLQILRKAENQIINLSSCTKFKAGLKLESALSKKTPFLLASLNITHQHK